jgi:hypothetical protein
LQHKIEFVVFEKKWPPLTLPGQSATGNVSPKKDYLEVARKDSWPSFLLFAKGLLAVVRIR